LGGFGIGAAGVISAAKAVLIAGGVIGGAAGGAASASINGGNLLIGAIIGGAIGGLFGYLDPPPGKTAIEDLPQTFTSEEFLGIPNGTVNVHAPVQIIKDVGLTPTQSTIGAATGISALIPIYGSGRNAIHHFQSGNYALGAFYTAMAASDVFLVKGIVTGLARGAWKLGGHSWRVTQGWYAQSRNLAPKTPVHHVYFEQGGILKNQKWLINQPWNLKPLSSMPESHFVHGWSFLGVPGHNILGRVWFGTQGWAKNAVLDVEMHAIDYATDQ
jgi:hypothetical protein